VRRSSGCVGRLHAFYAFIWDGVGAAEYFGLGSFLSSDRFDRGVSFVEPVPRIVIISPQVFFIGSSVPSCWVPFTFGLSGGLHPVFGGIHSPVCLQRLISHARSGGGYPVVCCRFWFVGTVVWVRGLSCI
jgi:hypothetical protein